MPVAGNLLVPLLTVTCAHAVFGAENDLTGTCTIVGTLAETAVVVVLLTGDET